VAGIPPARVEHELDRLLERASRARRQAQARERLVEMQHQAAVLPLVDRYGGRLIDTAGDGILAEFPSVINATECAVEIQTVMATRNEGVPESRRMRFRIGINLGDVIHDEIRIYGDGINVAARLEGIA
jgi:class 3 adenylate cyclase